MENITSMIISLTALLTAIAGLIVALNKAKKTIEETIPQKIKKQCNIDYLIINKMEEAKEFLRADRVQVYDFHNGGHFANGRSALKTSCTYEVCRAGVKSYQMYLQSIPLNCIPQFVSKLLNDNKMQINNLEDIKEIMPATYSLKKSQNIKSYFDIILNNEFNEPIGFLAIQYENENKVNFSEKELNEILKLKFFIEENLEKMIEKSNKM